MSLIQPQHNTYLDILHLLTIASIFCLVALFGCSQSDKDSIDKGTGGVPPVNEWNWCTHTVEERLWIHNIPGSMETYVGDKAFKKYQEYCVELAKEKTIDAPTIIDFLKFQQLSPSEVNSLIEQVNADCKLVNMAETYNEKARNEIISSLFGEKPINLSKVDVAYKVKFLKDFDVPVNVYDDAIYAASLDTDNIYTQDVYDKVRKEVYGSTKMIEKVPAVSSEEQAVSRSSSEWEEYYSSKAAAYAASQAAAATSSQSTVTSNITSSR